MAVYFVTGKLGGGKTLAAVGRIRDYLERGCRVATNLDLNLETLLGPKKRNTVVYRLPDKPLVCHLEMIGRGNESYDESKNGLLVLDECGTWFNSRNWNDKSRQPIIDWFLHARKLGWDLIFIVQDIALVDKQAREALAEHVVYCRRLDRIRVPFLGGLYKLLTGNNLTGPKVHIGIVKYGDRENSLMVDRWVYRGRDLYNAYDTKQVFRQTGDGVYQMLPSWYSHGRYLPVKNFMWYKRKLRRYYLRNPWVSSFASFVAVLPFLLLAIFSAIPDSSNAIPVLSTNDKKAESTSIYSNVSSIESNALSTQPPYWVSGLKITGSVGGDQTIYMLENVITGDSFVSSNFEKMGYRVLPVSACKIELVGMGWTHEVTCIAGILPTKSTFADEEEI